MSATPKDPPETRRYIGAGYYLLIGKCVELGCDAWPDDEGVLLQYMTPEDGHAMATAMANSVARPTPGAAPDAPTAGRGVEGWAPQFTALLPRDTVIASSASSPSMRSSASS